MSSQGKQTSTHPPKIGGREERPLSEALKLVDPARNLAVLEQRVEGKGPLTEEAFDEFLQEAGNVWPAEEELEDFLSWLRQSRREGRYH